MSHDPLAENINLLYQITKTPEKPHDNPVPRKYSADVSPRSLSFKQELGFIGALSFISSYTDDNSKVAAMCVEEVRSQHKLIINVAANAGDLDNLVSGLDGITKILMDESRSVSQDVNEDRLLQEIVSFNRQRILSRLRSRHASEKAKRKTPIIQSLVEATQELRRLGRRAPETLPELEMITQELNRLFHDIECLSKSKALSPEVDVTLVSLLKASMRVTSINGISLAIILKPIPFPGTSFSQERKVSLDESFRKLSRYLSIGPYILRLSRHCPSFQSIYVSPVALPSLSIDKGSSAAPDVQQKSLLDQYTQQHRTKKRIKTINRLESHMGQSLSAIQKGVKREARRDKRIHAEIQLVFHYEQRTPTNLLPRVICSTKNACYLCNLFLRLHDQFYTPKTHGKLYPQWTLPNPNTFILSESKALELEDLYHKFGLNIEQKVFSSLGMNALTQIFDNESRILELPSQTASEVSTHRVTEEVIDVENSRPTDLNLSQDDNSKTSSSPQRGLQMDHPPKTASSAHSKLERPLCALTQPDHVEVCVVNSTVSYFSPSAWNDVSTSNASLLIEQGQLIKFTVSADWRPIQIRTPHIHLEFVHETNSYSDSINEVDKGQTGGAETLQVSLQWLRPAQVASLENQVQMVDLDGVWTCEALQRILVHPDGLILRRKEVAIRIMVT